MDSVPGAIANVKLSGSDQFEEASFYGSSMWKKPKPEGKSIEIEGTSLGVIHEDGLILSGSDGVLVNVKKVKVGGRMKLASALGQESQQIKIDYTEEEADSIESIRNIWASILNTDVTDDTDLFAAGAGSMDVVR